MSQLVFCREGFHFFGVQADGWRPVMSKLLIKTLMLNFDPDEQTQDYDGLRLRQPSIMIYVVYSSQY